MEENKVSPMEFPEREQRYSPKGLAEDLPEGLEGSEGSGLDGIGMRDAPDIGRAGANRSCDTPKKRGTRSMNVHRHPVYPSEFKLRIVKLRLEEGHEVRQICEQSGISQSALFHWVNAYRAHGEAGLLPASSAGRSGREQCPAAVKDRIVALKQAEPSAGVKRISQVLRRWFHLPNLSVPCTLIILCL